MLQYRHLVFLTAGFFAESAVEPGDAMEASAIAYCRIGFAVCDARWDNNGAQRCRNGFDQVTMGESNEFSSQAKASRNESAVLIRLADMETSLEVIER